MELKIEDIINKNGWKTMEITPETTLTHNDNCLCCNHKLKLLTKITTLREEKEIDLGCCPNCGFITYIQKPTHDWIIDFYNSKWNENESKNIDFINKNLKSNKLTDVLEKHHVPKESLICEIGTGRGGNFFALKNHGYNNLVGIENSKHRAEVLHQHLPNTSIYSGGFEEVHIQEKLKKHGKYNVIYTAHVLEHIYDPSQTIELCSKLQNDDGLLIIAVPNFYGEPTMGILNFLPHLHSFTKTALTHLLLKYNYDVIDDSLTTETEVFLVAKKISVTKTLKYENKNFIEKARKKIHNELKLSPLPKNRPVYFWFSRKDYSETGFRILSNNYLIYFFQKLYFKHIKKHKNTRSVIVKKTDNGPYPLKIVHKKTINLFYK